MAVIYNVTSTPTVSHAYFSHQHLPCLSQDLEEPESASPQAPSLATKLGPGWGPKHVSENSSALLLIEQKEKVTFKNRKGKSLIKQSDLRSLAKINEVLFF